MGNISENNIIVSKNIMIFKNSSDFSCFNDSINIKTMSNNNISKNDFTIEDKDKYNDFNDMDSISNINSLCMNNLFEINNLSSITSTNDKQPIDKNVIINPFLRIETTNLPKKQKIFNIYKLNKKIGRIKKNSGFIGKHNKLSEDNVIRKIKRRFLENVRLYINKEYKNYYMKKKININNNNWLKKITPKCSIQIKKKDNLKWFNSKLFEVFSENLSLRYSSHCLDSNKKNIQKLLSSNEFNNVKDILNTKVEILFSLYIKDVKIEGFKTLKDDIKELEKQMINSKQENIKDYLEKYEDTAKNMKDIFDKKSERNLKK
jgi:hypothetical protein